MRLRCARLLHKSSLFVDVVARGVEHGSVGVPWQWGGKQPRTRTALFLANSVHDETLCVRYVLGGFDFLGGLCSKVLLGVLLLLLVLCECSWHLSDYCVS